MIIIICHVCVCMLGVNILNHYTTHAHILIFNYLIYYYEKRGVVGCVSINDP